ncbi:hypothetical protein KSF_015830 [Reticulibacter mediterranei]|uniref:Uncharacterized protein n=1 Tax=Reticulibacter mediterranei TaxID=2778369 RepID=A0A8J3IFG0_9CHLR|nr:hypothetical protein [Reticulibacter mediterranei]GHO91535.1 hypothetical protein KSF_015830 [Reticulibacter mediterranei]
MTTTRRSRTTRGPATSVTASSVVAPVSTMSYAPSTHPPKFITAVGVGFLILWVVALMTQIQTNEAFITNAGQINVYHPNWAILWQPIALIAGQQSPQEAIATIFGWGIELVYLGFVVGYELMQHSVARSGALMGRIFKTGSWIIVGFNFWTDYNYGTLSTAAWGHIAFAFITGFIVGFFGTIGLALIEHGWSRA